MCEGQIVKQFNIKIQAEQEQFFCNSFFSFYRCFTQIIWSGSEQKRLKCDL